MDLAISFLLGVASSLIAAVIVFYSQRARFRLRFSAVLALLVGLAHQLRGAGFSPDYIVAVDRNSGVVGSILAGHLGLRSVVAVSTVNRRLANGARETKLDAISEQMLQLLKGSKVLVMVCCNNSGTSLKLVVEYLISLDHNAPAEIKTAAVYTSNLPSMYPTFHCAEVGRDTSYRMDHIMSHLPWMTRNWYPRVPKTFDGQ